MPAPSTPSLRARLSVGAAAALTAAALIGAGVASASASTGRTPSPSITAPASTRPQARAWHPLAVFLNLGPNSPQAAGDRAAKAATALSNHPQVFSKLPAALQTDLTALKNAPAADRVKDAYKIKTTALNGGYGTDIEKRAQNLQKTATARAGLRAGLRAELRSVLQSANPGAALQQIADQLICRPKLFAKLPSSLQSDLKTLKTAAPAGLDAQAIKIKTTALTGGYGPRIQKALQHLQTRTTPAANAHS